MSHSNVFSIKDKISAMETKINKRISELIRERQGFEVDSDDSPLKKRVAQLIFEKLKDKATLLNYNIFSLNETQVSAFLKDEYKNMPYRFMDNNFRTDIVRSKIEILDHYSQKARSQDELNRQLYTSMQRFFAIRMLNFIEATLDFPERRLLGLDNTATISPCSRFSVYWRRLSELDLEELMDKPPLYEKIKFIKDYHESLRQAYLKPFDDKSKGLINIHHHNEEVDGIFFSEAELNNPLLNNPLQAVIEYKSHLRRFLYQEELNEVYAYSLPRFDYMNIKEKSSGSSKIKEKSSGSPCSPKDISKLKQIEVDLGYFHDIKSQLKNIEVWLSSINEMHSISFGKLERVLKNLDNSFIFLENHYTGDIDSKYLKKSFADKSKEFSKIIKELKSCYNFILDAVFNSQIESKQSQDQSQVEQLREMAQNIFEKAQESPLINQHRSRFKFLQPFKTKSRKRIDKRLEQLSA